MDKKQFQKLKTQWDQKLAKEGLGELEKISGTRWTFGTVSGARPGNLGTGPTFVSYSHGAPESSEQTGPFQSGLEAVNERALETFGTANVWDLSARVDKVQDCANKFSYEASVVQHWAGNGSCNETARAFGTSGRKVLAIVHRFLKQYKLKNPWSHTGVPVADPEQCQDKNCSSHGRVHPPHNQGKTLSKAQVAQLNRLKVYKNPKQIKD